MSRAGELFFLRLLLMRVPGPTSFLDLPTVDGELPPTMQQARSARPSHPQSPYSRHQPQEL